MVRKWLVDLTANDGMSCSDTSCPCPCPCFCSSSCATSGSGSPRARLSSSCFRTKSGCTSCIMGGPVETLVSNATIAWAKDDIGDASVSIKCKPSFCGDMVVPEFDLHFNNSVLPFFLPIFKFFAFPRGWTLPARLMRRVSVCCAACFTFARSRRYSSLRASLLYNPLTNSSVTGNSSASAIFSFQVSRSLYPPPRPLT